jgi:hypothetical protein
VYPSSANALRIGSINSKFLNAIEWFNLIKAGKDVAFSESAEIFYHIGLQPAVCL